MKKLLVAFFIFISFSSFAQVRNTTWGDSFEKVISIEGSDYDASSEDGLRYSREMGGIKRSLIYLFDENKKLYLVSWVIDSDEYEDYFSILEEKYGSNYSCVSLAGRSWVINTTTIIFIDTDFISSAQMSYIDIEYLRKKNAREKAKLMEGL